MHTPEKNALLLSFIPARLTEGKEWYVSFYAFDPTTEKLTRKKIKLNRIQSVSMRRTIGRKMVAELNAKLLGGWNPFIEQEASKSFHKLFDVLKTYIATIEKEAEENTIRSYRSFLEKLKTWVDMEQKKKDMYVYQFSKFMASELMIYINSLQNVSPRTYNNYLRFYKTLFNWMIQYNYIKNNPFSDIHKKATKKQKNRVPIPEDLRRKLKDHLEKENHNFLVIMLIEYYCLLRPKEILFLRISDIDLERKLIRVDQEEAKNDNTSFRTIPDILIPFLQKLDLSGNKENFVFSNDGHYRFMPGKEHMDPRKISKYWAKLRDKFGFAMNYKFYSLKDTGIIDLLEMGVSPEDVRDQADHYDLSVTSIYARHIKPEGSKQIRKLAKEF